MDIKYPIENEYMKCVLQINGFNNLRPWVRSSRQVRLGGRDTLNHAMTCSNKSHNGPQSNP